MKGTNPARRRTPLPLLAAALLLAAAAALTLLRPAPGSADPAIDCFEQDFLTLINQYRAENGRTPLQLNIQLSAAADWMSADLGANDYFSHIDSLGRDPGQRARDYGYYGGVGENIAAGMAYSSAQGVFNGWKNSPGHNANMLGSSYRVIGIGRDFVPNSPYGVYWTTDFGLTANGAGDPPPDISCGATPRPSATATPRSTPT
ncbi:MAG TPA: CAP domain-containing protein, partial [Dehalococcoidia bacterium]|nr:CAP domain-containing protein [Dehalococcoidia bacterium]